MSELDKVLKNTKEEKFIEYLDFYNDTDYTFEVSNNVYTYHFLDTIVYPSCNVTLVFTKQGRLKQATCDCDSEDNGYCVHILAAYIHYYTSKHPGFSILDYVIDKTKDVDDIAEVWLEPIIIDDEDADDYYDDQEDFEDEFLAGLGLDEEEIEAIKNFDVSEPLSQMTKQELIEFITSMSEDFPPLHYAIIERLALDFMEETFGDKEVSEEEFEDFLLDMQGNKHKPS